MNGVNLNRSLVVALLVGSATGCAEFSNTRSDPQMLQYPKPTIPPPTMPARYAPSPAGAAPAAAAARVGNNAPVVTAGGVAPAPAGGTNDSVFAAGGVPVGLPSTVQPLPILPDQAPKPSGELALPIPKPADPPTQADPPPLETLPPPQPTPAPPPNPGKQTPAALFPGVPVEPSNKRPTTVTAAKQNTTQAPAPTEVPAKQTPAPADVPTDRVVDLTQRLATALAQNKELLAKIRELEAIGATREQALTAALREVETASAEVAKTRATILALRTEVTALQKTIQQMEKEDVEIMRTVITALEKVLPPQAATPGSP